MTLLQELLLTEMFGAVMYKFRPPTDNKEKAIEMQRWIGKAAVVHSCSLIGFDQDDPEKWQIDVRYKFQDAMAVSRVIHNNTGEDQGHIRAEMLKQKSMMG